jgi:hypothetical protein
VQLVQPGGGVGRPRRVRQVLEGPLGGRARLRARPREPRRHAPNFSRSRPRAYFPRSLAARLPRWTRIDRFV